MANGPEIDWSEVLPPPRPPGEPFRLPDPFIPSPVNSAIFVRNPADPTINTRDGLYAQIPGWSFLRGSAYCRCGGDPRTTTVMAKVLVWPVRSLYGRGFECIDYVHDVAHLYGLNHVGLETREHMVRVYCPEAEDKNRWLAIFGLHDWYGQPIHVEKADRLDGVGTADDRI